MLLSYFSFSFSLILTICLIWTADCAPHNAEGSKPAFSSPSAQLRFMASASKEMQQFTWNSTQKWIRNWGWCMHAQQWFPSTCGSRYTVTSVTWHRSGSWQRVWPWRSEATGRPRVPFWDWGCKFLTCRRCMSVAESVLPNAGCTASEKAKRKSAGSPLKLYTFNSPCPQAYWVRIRSILCLSGWEMEAAKMVKSGNWNFWLQSMAPDSPSPLQLQSRFCILVAH